MAGANTLEFTDANFDAEVLQSPVPVLVDFWAPWCGPCRLLGPIIDEIATERVGKAKVGKVNVDEHGMIAGRFRVSALPTLLMFKNGEVREQLVGAGNSKASMLSKLDALA